MGEIDGAFRSWGFSRGGTGAISLAIAGAAREAGRRDPHRGARSRGSRSKDGRATGVVLPNGDEIDADVVLSSVDPRLTFLKLVRAAATCRPRSSRTCAATSSAARRARSTSRSTACRTSRACPGPGAHLRGAISISPERRVHGARLRRREVRRLLAAAVHRHRDPVAHRPVGRAARQARAVVLRAVRALQAARGHLGREARGLRRHRDRHARRVRAEPQAASSCTARC